MTGKFIKELHKVLHKDDFPFYPHVWQVIDGRIEEILELLEGFDLEVDKRINKIRKGEL